MANQLARAIIILPIISLKERLNLVERYEFIKSKPTLLLECNHAIATTYSAAASITVLIGPQSRRSEVDGVAQLATVDSVCMTTVAEPAQGGER